MAAFCPAVTRMACWVTAVGDDAACPAELELPCFPPPCAGWPTKNVPWVQEKKMAALISVKPAVRNTLHLYGANGEMI